ncbi:hypothetical protein Bca4012_031214 [Brassica carinata]|uniref:Uncharacterized protein n=1 Tax=Brassica carinata TaxID=52824 RepID=A0A8X7RHG9_BRACI|nr:hypothetical protein Bca52824_047541 [Brassica carinata]
MKGGVSLEAEPPTKKQKKVKTQNESEAAATGKGSSEKEGSKDLEMENKATLTTITGNKPLMDQKTIDDRVKALLEERLKVLGVGKIPENIDNPSPPSADKSLSLASPMIQTQQKSVNSLALAATPVRTLAKEFGSVAKATDLDSQHLDFIVVSPAKATKDDKDAKVPAYGRGCRGRRTVKDEDAADKKKAAQADAALKRKEKAEAKKKEANAKKKEAEGKKKEAEASKKEAELKKKQEAELKKQKQAESKTKKVTPPRAGVTRCKVQKSGDDSVFADVTDAVVAEENEFESRDLKWLDLP